MNRNSTQTETSSLLSWHVSELEGGGLNFSGFVYFVKV